MKTSQYSSVLIFSYSLQWKVGNSSAVLTSVFIPPLASRTDESVCQHEQPQASWNNSVSGWKARMEGFTTAWRKGAVLFTALGK